MVVVLRDRVARLLPGRFDEIGALSDRRDVEDSSSAEASSHEHQYGRAPLRAK